MPTSVAGLSQLIESYKADPEKTGNSLAKFLMELITHHSVKNKIASAAGSDATHLSLEIDELVEEVRQEAIVSCMMKFRDPKFLVMTDRENAKYVFNAVKFAAQGLLDHHLGSKRRNGPGRTKGLSSSPFKWGTEEADEAGYASVLSMKANSVDADPAKDKSEIRSYLDSIQASDEKLHTCLSLYLEGFTQNEIAAVMAVDDRTIRNYLKKAKDAISSTDDS